MRTRNSLLHKASKALCSRLFIVLSSIPYQKIMGSQSAWRGDKRLFLVHKVRYRSHIKIIFEGCIDRVTLKWKQSTQQSKQLHNNIIKKLFKLKNNNYDHLWIRYGYCAPSTTWFSVDHKSLKIAQIKKIKTLCVSKSIIFFRIILSKNKLLTFIPKVFVLPKRTV